MRRMYEILEILPVLLIFVAWVAMVVAFFGSFYLPASEGVAL